MTISIFTVLFLALLLLIAYFGLRYVMGQGTIPAEDVDKEKCSLCRKKFFKTELIVREVADVRVFFFCKECIAQLSREVQ